MVSPGILVLNGPSSSGKTTIARAAQNRLGANCVVVSIDQLYPCLHPARTNDWELFRTLTVVLFACARSFHAQGLHVIVDTVFERPECLEICRATFGEKPFYLVALTSPIEILEQREADRQNRRAGLARNQHARVHTGCTYDLTIDTSLQSVDECASRVVKLLAESHI